MRKITLIVLLLTTVLYGRAQQFTVSTDTIMVYFNSENGVTSYTTTWLSEHSVQYQGYFYEDDRYQVKFVLDGLHFIEKQLTWEAKTSNGSLQMEPVYRQYKRCGKPIRILKNDGKYYFIHRCQIRELREDLHPGGRVYSTTLFSDPMVRDMFELFSWSDKGYFTETYLDEARIVIDMTTDITYGRPNGYVKHVTPITHYSKNGVRLDTIINNEKSSCYKYCCIDGDRHGDMIFEGAFCVNGEIYTVVNPPQNTYIARLDGDSLTMVVDLGQHFLFDNPLKNFYLISRQNMSANCCLLEFNSKYGTGVIDIEDTTVRIRYFKHVQSYRS